MIKGAGLVGTNVAYFLSEKNKHKINVYDAGEFSAKMHQNYRVWRVLIWKLKKTFKAESNAAVTSKANAGNFAAFAMKYGGNVETGMARLFLPGKDLIHLSKISQFQP